MILVTSANGNVGRKIIGQLAARDLKVRALDINPQAGTLKDVGAAEVQIGDARRAEVLRRALRGCDKVVYIPPLFVYDEARMAELCIDAAVQEGVGQYVFMSVAHPNMSTLLQHTQKLRGEEHLVYKGLSDGLNYTILQPMHYNHNFSVPLVMADNRYDCFYTLTTKLSYVDCEEVGEVTAKILSEDIHANATYELCGPDFLSPMDMVEIFNRVSGRQAAANKIDVEDFLEMIGNQDSYRAETFRCLADTYGRYGIAGNPNVLRWLLGREPTTFEQYVRRELERGGR